MVLRLTYHHVLYSSYETTPFTKSKTVILLNINHFHLENFPNSVGVKVNLWRMMDIRDSLCVAQGLKPGSYL